MQREEIFEGKRETAWCPGCGNFAIRKALISALSQKELGPEDVTLFTGIGQAAKMPHYLKINGFNGLHGRALPPALGMRIANPKLQVIVESGDGDTYGEGGNHFLHNIRRNPDLVHLVHNNQIYGLTKGQASPTTASKVRSLFQPHARPLNPLFLALSLGAGFVARAFAGDEEQLKDLIIEAMDYQGYALIDILQPCVSFNRVNTYQWYRERVYHLGSDYDPLDYEGALKKSREWGAKIPTGVIYKEPGRKTFREGFEHLGDRSLVEEETEPARLKELLQDFR